MFAVLDTNHFTEFLDASPPGHRLMERMEERKPDVFTCIVAVEETFQGWLALLHRLRRDAISWPTTSSKSPLKPC